MKRVLVVDRQESNQLYAVELIREGYAVTCLPDGFSAAREIEANPPDIVIVDAMLPGMSGIELVLKIKSSNPKLPVIMHTSWDLYKDNYLAWIADKCLVKCGNTGQLLSTVKGLLAWSEDSHMSGVKRETGFAHVMT